MKWKYLLAIISVACLSSCGERSVPNTDIDVARAFIKDILENNFKEAEKFVLKEDSVNSKEDTNKQYFDLFKKDYESKGSEELEKYRNADIIINEISPVNDSVSIVNFSNSFKKDKSNKVKMVRVNGQWLVDLKYTFQEICKCIQVIRNFLLIGLGGALGSMLRYGSALLIGSRQFPLAILLINITGSFIIGSVMAYSLKNEVFAGNWRLFLATGICGGFTTFSAFSLDNLLLFENEKFGMLAINIAASVLLGIAAVWMGFKITNLATR